MRRPPERHMFFRREMEKMKDAVNAAAGGDGVPTRRIAGDAGREYILQTEEDTKAKAALDAGVHRLNLLRIDISYLLLPCICMAAGVSL